MSDREIQKKILWMKNFDKEMRAKGKKPSMAWLAAMKSQGTITVYDPAYML